MNESNVENYTDLRSLRKMYSGQCEACDYLLHKRYGYCRNRSCSRHPEKIGELLKLLMSGIEEREATIAALKLEVSQVKSRLGV